MYETMPILDQLIKLKSWTIYISQFDQRTNNRVLKVAGTILTARQINTILVRDHDSPILVAGVSS